MFSVRISLAGTIEVYYIGCHTMVVYQEGLNDNKRLVTAMGRVYGFAWHIQWVYTPTTARPDSKPTAVVLLQF